MLSTLFNSVITDGTITAAVFAEITFASLICGLIIAVAYMIKNKCSKSFVITLVLLPAIVELVIILGNGNVGTGVAVAGAFSLVRFRSAPGKGQEITSIFLAMAVGLALGMGYIGIALVFTILIAGLNLLLNVVGFGGMENDSRTLRITVPVDKKYEV